MSAERAPRIAIVTTSYPRTAGDAAGHFVATEARALARAGAIVTVLCPGPARLTLGNPRVVSLADGGASGSPGLRARLAAEPLRAFGLTAWALRTRHALRRLGPFDRVIGHWLVPTAFPLLASSALSGAELEIVVHGSDARLFASLPRWLRRWSLAGLLERGATFRCVSHELAQLLEQSAGVALSDRIRVSPSPIDCSSAPSRDAARAELGITPGTRLVLIVARLVRQKRVEEALATASLLRDIQIVVLGAGPEEARLRQRFPAARFLGQRPRPEALRWIAAADAVLSASRQEGSPTTLREARSLDVPVAALATGDLIEWAQSDPNLWVVP